MIHKNWAELIKPTQLEVQAPATTRCARPLSWPNRSSGALA